MYILVFPYNKAIEKFLFYAIQRSRYHDKTGIKKTYEMVRVSNVKYTVFILAGLKRHVPATPSRPHAA